MRLLLVLMVLVGGIACAEGVERDMVTSEDILDLYDRAVAVEIQVPEDATIYTLAFGPAGKSFGISRFLDQNPMQDPPTILRVVTYLPDPADVDPCPEAQAQATIVVTPKGDEWRGSASRQNVCVPHPEKSRITGRLESVIEGDAPLLGEWKPLLFHVWLVRESQDENGAIASAIDLQKHYAVQVYFGSGNETGALGTTLRLQDFTGLPSVAHLIEEYGVFQP